MHSNTVLTPHGILAQLVLFERAAAGTPGLDLMTANLYICILYVYVCTHTYILCTMYLWQWRYHVKGFKGALCA